MYSEIVQIYHYCLNAIHSKTHRMSLGELMRSSSDVCDAEVTALFVEVYEAELAFMK